MRREAQEPDNRNISKFSVLLPATVFYQSGTYLSISNRLPSKIQGVRECQLGLLILEEDLAGRLLGQYFLPEVSVVGRVHQS